ncbi:amidohydrolase family protein [Maricaulis sp.]|uniref:amidohydrolase family protein n=1 Tax=Maricaulis sp. TaxID=1486257 RepID=UPI001B299863|nr:amidohydrolase family protein [Maricaulis sp.]MBO6765050.1 amidohydrolase family protein [Maricaulis sp.]
MTLTLRPALPVLFAAALFACSPASDTETATTETAGTAAQTAEATRFTVMVGGTAIGALEVTPSGDSYSLDYEYRNNGRGPTLAEEITLDGAGMPLNWTIEGATTFGNPVDESFEYADSEARWTDTTGSDQAIPAEPAFYVPQNASPYWLAIAARALMDSEDMSLPAIPGGTLRLAEMETLDVSDGTDTRTVTSYALSGTSLDPTYFLMDGRAFFGVISPRFSVLAEGFEGEDERLRQRATDYGAQRYEDMQSRFAHNYGAPVRIRNVRVFDSVNATLGEPVSVVVVDDTIAAIEAIDAEPVDGEVIIDGNGGTLVPGLFEMHGHVGEDDAILNIAAGVTSIRDMGNDNEVLGELIERIRAGEIAGPRIFRSGFIEGRSQYNSNNGIIVESEAEAVAAVETYAEAGDFIQIKIYNSINPDWVPAMIETAHANGLRVSGHVPAFTNADAMIAAGYDELTHINQLMLGWVLEDGEDTRTLLRLTALRRLPALDLQSAPVQSTLDAMAERGVAIDPTLAIHEALLLSRNGQVSPGTVDYIDHMPVGVQRSARSAWADIATPEDDANYAGAFDQVQETIRMMHERGIFMVPGTDLGGAFAYHRELELYQSAGMTPAEILAWASHGMADYLGVAGRLGSIAPGMRADFFLVPGNPVEDLADIKTISLVSSDGTFYYPTEIYPEFGIEPFTELPGVAVPN